MTSDTEPDYALHMLCYCIYSYYILWFRDAMAPNFVSCCQLLLVARVTRGATRTRATATATKATTKRRAPTRHVSHSVRLGRCHRLPLSPSLCFLLRPWLAQTARRAVGPGRRVTQWDVRALKQLVGVCSPLESPVSFMYFIFFKLNSSLILNCGKKRISHLPHIHHLSWGLVSRHSY